MSSLFTLLRDQVYDLWRQIRSQTGDESVLPLLRPVAPYAGTGALSPLTMLGTLLALAITSGIALGAFGVLLLASLVLYFLFTEVLGLTIEVRQPF
jgi:hypothetical protein